MRRLTTHLAVLALHVGLLTAFTTTVLGSASADESERRSPTTEWVVPESFYDPDSTPGTWQQIYRAKPPAHTGLFIGTQSLIEFKGWKWSKWGARRVRGHGRTRLCDAPSTGCRAWHHSRLVLKKRSRALCGEGVIRYYSRYTLIRFPSVKRDTYKSFAAC